MSERDVNPKIAPLITKPGASKEYIGTRDVTSFLPNIFQTDVNKKFLDSTLEQLMSSGSLQPIRNYIGSRFNKDTYNENYISDGRDSDAYQFVPGMINRDEDQNVTQTLPYDDLINTLKFNEVNTNNHNNILNEQGLTLDLPINYDMFINYHHYLWLLDTLPPAEIKPTSSNVIDIDTIVSESTYTTPTLSTNNTLTLQNGMRIRFMPTHIDRFTQTNNANTTFTATAAVTTGTLKVYKNNILQTLTTHYTYNSGTGVVTFTSAPALTDEIEIHTFYAHSTSGNYAVGDIYIVDNVGGTEGIALTKQFTSGQVEGTYSERNWLNHTVYSSQEPTGFDEHAGGFDFRPFDLKEFRMTTRDYVVEQRHSRDQSAWARSNLWVHVDTARAILTFQNANESEYILDTLRAVRPIIEYKANIEKHSFGRTHIANVSYIIEQSIDPATLIVGQTTFDWNIQGINYAWSQGYGGYELGAKVYVDIGTSPNQKRMYYECIQTHTTPANPIHGENKQFWKRIVPVEIENGDTILFKNTSNSTFNERIFRVSGVGSSIALTEIFGSNSTTINNNDKILIIHGHNLAEDLDNENDQPYGGCELYYSGNVWTYGQQKMARSTAMEVNLYDLNGTMIGDTTAYPNTTYKGTSIFDYVHNTANTVDDALGFAPDYVDYGNNPGINFQIPFLSNRYEYAQVSTDNTKSKTLEIQGYYLYKKFNGYLYNGWSITRNGQPIKRVIEKTVTDSSLPLTFDLGHDSYITDRYYNIFQRFGKLQLKSQASSDITNIVNDMNGYFPTLFMNTNTTYTFRTYFAQALIEFVNMDGSAIGSGLTRNAGSDDVFTLAITTPTVNQIKYRLVADPTNYGIINFNTNAYDVNLKVYKNASEVTNYTISNNILTVGSGLVKNDVYEVEYYTNSQYSATAEGNQKVADTHILNPQNNDLTKMSFGDLIDHMRDQMTAIPGFTGNYFGQNNYRNITHVHEFGGTIRQQPYSTELLSQLLMDNDTNVFNSIRYASSNYDIFINQFKQKVLQLHKTLDTSKSVYELVDKALEAIHVGKNKDSLFARSDMAMYRDYESVEYSWDSTSTKVFDVPQSINTYDDTQNHVQVWINDDDGSGNLRWRGIIKGVDYTIASNKITITGSVTYPASGVAKAHVRWYKRDSVSFVPSSSVKLGLAKPYIPELRTDYSKDSTGTTTDSVIIGHDGNIHIRLGTELYNRSSSNFNAVDAALWDLELRIYNNLNSDLDAIENIKTYTPNGQRSNRYSWTQYQNTIKSEFNKWRVTNNKTDYNSSSYYDGSDQFTWNYSSVSPNIGGWRGIYHYFFNTDRPHTHPWEMMGYNSKPSWWDANYSWTNASERTALINALKYGKISDPSTQDVYDTNYAYNNYDWSTNTLVTLLGALNDPITAGVVTTPSATDRIKDFNYGDWGPIEAEWRRTSAYKISEFLALLKTRPLIASNNYFELNARTKKDISSFIRPHIVNVENNKLQNYTKTKISGTEQTGKIIESVLITDQGSGYTSAPTVSIFDNFGQDASISVFIEGGKVVSASVTNPGKDYYNTPILFLSTGSAKLQITLASNAKRYIAGYQNAITEYALSNGTTSDTINKRFEFAEYRPMIKAGGFVNENNRFMLESSQDKGRVFIPEENYKTILYNSKPNVEYFYSGVKIDKVTNGYKISGYDNSNYYFNYTAPNTSSNQITVSIDNLNLIRYANYTTTVSQLDYNTTLPTIQSVYDFILGYGEYLNGLGFEQDWKAQGVAFATWANGTSVETIYLIPDNNSIIVDDSGRGYFDSLENKYDGVYNINNKLGQRIRATDLIIDRNFMDPDSTAIFKSKISTTEIYGLRLYKTEIEHLFVFDTVTNFDDTVYNPAIGQAHKRVIWQGNRTKNWNGKLYSPGFIVNDNSIIPNFDSVAGQLDQYMGRTNELANKQVTDVARFNIGYNKPSWANNLDIDDDTLFEFVKGTYKYRGTKYAVDAFLRNKGLFDTDATGNLYEEWAIRTNDFGDVRKRETLEFQITKELLTTSPQPVRFTDGEKNDVLTDITIDIDSNSPLLVTGKPGSRRYIIGNNFTTRPAKIYTQTNITNENIYADDFITAGLPLTSETDFRVLTREHMLQFPQLAKSEYTFEGNWQDTVPWEKDVSYKFNDKVLYQGDAYEMVDPKGYTGLSSATSAIEVTGTTTLPITPSGGSTFIIDGTTVNLTKTQTTSALGVIQKIGTQDIVTSNTVAHGSTLILGESSALAQTITFANSVSTTQYSNIVKTGTVSNPTFVGSAAKTLIIDGNTITFDDTVSSTTNITLQTAYENAFNTSSFSNPSSLATNRINALEALRVGYINATSSSDWATFLTTYHSVSDAGINMSQLLTLTATNPAYKTQLDALITSDVALINAQTGNSYVATAVINGSTVIPNSDITATQNAVDNGQYITATKTYLIANPTVTITASTVVTTQSGSVFKTYTLTDIVNKITGAGISNVTASATSNFLRITKTTSTPTNPFSLVISAGTANADVGFSSVTETISATSSVTTSTPNLTITQVVNQINNAGISGITAAVNSANTNLLQINCNLSSLFIGTGTANGTIGFTTGITPASTTTSTTNVALTINDIVDKINTATISGVTASNSNNRLKLTSVNATMVIGAGTANSVLGMTAQTYTATTTSVSNVFNAIVNGVQVFKEMTNDPNIFSIWVADDSEYGDFNRGYQVYQTMDLGMYISNSCAGIVSADEAQVTVARSPSSATQAHNLVLGDYVLIRGSTTVPSIDGIHQVTRVDSSNNAIFYIDEYIEQEGKGGNIYPLRKVRFNSYSELDSNKNLQVNGVYKYNFNGVRQNNSINPVYAFVDDDGSSVPAVYKWVGSFDNSNGHNNGSWNLVRSGIAQARNDLIENVKIYDAINRTSIANIEVWDPAKGIIFGFIDKEIDYKLVNDIGSYNYNTNSGEITNLNAWKDEYVGVRWWDLSTAIYFDYEQSVIDYQQANWGKLFDGASIDIYEWTKSPVTPEQWQQAVDDGLIIDGQEVTGEAYFNLVNNERVYDWTEQNYYNQKTKRNETVYYFWVKNKQNFSGNRQYNVTQLSQILKDPNSFGLSWVAASGDDKLLLSNIANFVTDNSVVQVNQTYENTNSLPLNEFTLLADGDPNSYIPEYLHIKVRDSLAGYNNFSVDYNYTTWSSLTNYSADAVVQRNTNFYISLKDNNQNNDPALDTTFVNWARVYDYTLRDVTQEDDIRIWRGQTVPDYSLHKFNRYGHLVRPRQSLYRDIEEARHNFVEVVNDLLSQINLIDETTNATTVFNKTFTKGNITYNVGEYCNLVDWSLVERDAENNITFSYNTNTVADLVYESWQDYVNDTLSPPEGSYILIKKTNNTDNINRQEVYYYKNGVDKLVFKENATYELSEELWLQHKYGHGFDSSGFGIMPFDSSSNIVISNLMDILRKDVFIGRHLPKYNKMWFKLLYAAILQNTTDDFAFKTSFVKLAVQHKLLTSKKTYQKYDISKVEDYFNSIKPFHTKLLDLVDSNTHSEATDIQVDEEARNTAITMKYEDHTTRDWACDIVLEGGTFTGTATGDVDSITFTTLDSSIDFIYNGNIFQQPACEGWGEELYPNDFTENIAITVQTNPQGTVTAGATYSVVSEENQPRGITFNNDGTKMFITGPQGDDVNEYTLSTGFDLTSTVTFVDSYAVTQCPNPTAVKFNTDGTKMFVTGTGNSNVHEYALTTGFDVSTASFTQTLVTTVDNDNFGLDFKDDGTKMWITGNQNDKIYEYNLSSAFDISTATFNQDLSTQPHDFEPFGIEWSPDGTRLFIVGTIHNGVDLWYVSTPWDISTATHHEFYFVGGNPSGIHISPDGTKMFIVGNQTDLVKSYTLSVPYEFTTGSAITTDSRTFRMSIYQPNDIQFSNVIVDAHKTTLTSNVSGTDTTIPVASVAQLDDPNSVYGVGEVPGVVYINGERIEYDAIDGNNLLFCTRGTMGTSAKAHTSGDSVVHSGPTTRIPILEKFSHYEDNLRLAYNDSGISLSAAGISPEHAFIRNAGQGSI